MEDKTISSLNVWGNTFASIPFKPRAKKICRYFNTSKTDVLQLQEVFTFSKLEYFKKHLPAFPYCAFKRSFLGPRGGLATFSKSPLESIEYRDFSKKFIENHFKVGTLLTGKGMLKVKPKGLPVSFVNTHLSPNYVSPSYRTKTSDKGRYDALTLSQIRDLDEFTARQGTVIVTGDFNLAHGSGNYQELIGRGFVDIFSDYSTPTFHIEYASGDGKNYRIDFIFKKNAGGLQTSKKEELFKEERVSDHIGLQATIKT